MKKFRKYVGLLVAFELVLMLLMNFLYLKNNGDTQGRLYRVEANAVAGQLLETEAESLDLSQYQTIVGVEVFVPEEESNEDYVVKKAGDTLYRISYLRKETESGLIFMNIVFCFLLLLTVLASAYIGQKILRPFYNISGLPGELAKGNLSMPVKAEKSKFFGQFLWGMDMLRDRLESGRQKELELQKEKKTLLLSLTHDIKTPLSAIKLYTKAVSENLYDTEEKRKEAIAGIEKNVEEIENYIKEINQTAREDFLNLEVKMGEFYVSEVLQSIEGYYKEKLTLVHTEFEVFPQQDCLLKGDKERVIEVLQNIMENAMKYGDGRKVVISGEEEEDCRLLTVTNTGCSLKKEELPHIFDSFYRGSNTENVKGSGLGLYICRELMKQMDGEVFAKCKEKEFAVTVVIRKA